MCASLICPTQLTVLCQLVHQPLSQVNEDDIMSILLMVANEHVMKQFVNVSEDDTEYHRGQLLILGPEFDPTKKVVSEYPIIKICEAEQLLFSPFKWVEKDRWASTDYTVRTDHSKYREKTRLGM